jgi:hypothetical protein
MDLLVVNSNRLSFGIGFLPMSLLKTSIPACSYFFSFVGFCRQSQIRAICT